MYLARRLRPDSRPEARLPSSGSRLEVGYRGRHVTTDYVSGPIAPRRWRLLPCLADYKFALLFFGIFLLV